MWASLYSDQGGWNTTLFLPFILVARHLFYWSLIEEKKRVSCIDIVVLWRKSFVVDLVPDQLRYEKVNLEDYGWEYVECFNDCSTCNMRLVRMLFILWTCNMSTSVMIELSSFFDDINF